MTREDKIFIEEIKKEIGFKIDKEKSQTLINLVYDILQDSEAFCNLSMDRQGSIAIHIASIASAAIEEEIENL